MFNEDPRDPRNPEWVLPMDVGKTGRVETLKSWRPGPDDQEWKAKSDEAIAKLRADMAKPYTLDDLVQDAIQYSKSQKAWLERNQDEHGNGKQSKRDRKRR